MLTEVCAYLKNYFLVDYLRPEEKIHYGTFAIQGNEIQALPFLEIGQYFRVVGSVFNDGVWKNVERRSGETPQPGTSAAMTDETFTGAIWAMSVPPEVVDLAEEIATWRTANASALSGPYQSESFGGYSYSKASGGGSGGNTSAAYGWQDQFANRLAPYRRLSVL